MNSERHALARMAEAVSPGATVVAMRRLKGGIGARMHVMTLQASGGARERFVLRRYVRGRGNHGSPEAAVREFETLRLLAEGGIAAPKPVLLDGEGAYFGVPTIVESLVPGRTLVTPRDFEAWVRGLAGALLAVHSVTPETADLSHLKTFLRDGMAGELAKGVTGHSSRAIDLSANVLALESHAAMVRAFASVAWTEPCLVHNDYYPGNVLWYRGRVSGIVDWTTAEVGDRRADVAQCYVDLALMHGLDVAGLFVRRYEDLSGDPLPDMAFWELFRGLRAYGGYPSWLQGYHDLGLKYLTAEDLKVRVEAVLRSALERL